MREHTPGRRWPLAAGRWLAARASARHSYRTGDVDKCVADLEVCGRRLGERADVRRQRVLEACVPPPELKVRTPAHTKQPGWYLEFESRVTHRCTRGWRGATHGRSRSTQPSARAASKTCWGQRLCHLGETAVLIGKRLEGGRAPPAGVSGRHLQLLAAPVQVGNVRRDALLQIALVLGHLQKRPAGNGQSRSPRAHCRRHPPPPAAATRRHPPPPPPPLMPPPACDRHPPTRPGEPAAPVARTPGHVGRSVRARVCTELQCREVCAPASAAG